MKNVVNKHKDCCQIEDTGNFGGIKL